LILQNILNVLNNFINDVAISLVGHPALGAFVVIVSIIVAVSFWQIAFGQYKNVLITKVVEFLINVIKWLVTEFPWEAAIRVALCWVLISFLLAVAFATVYYALV
jgi:hypothetical protein